MRLVVHGGFAEKGRMCLAVETHAYRLLLDAGVKTSAHGRADYFPRISPDELRATDAILVTHGHEDHAAALGWCIANGFRGAMHMTAETWRDARASVADYGEEGDASRLGVAGVVRLRVGEAFTLGPFRIETGRSGHVAGGVWCAVDDGRVRFVYCGDVVPASPVFPMDAIARCDVAALDASYGDDDTPAARRADEVRAWIDAQPQGCVLPTPLYGRSVELLAIARGRLALAPGMREALAAQLRGRDWLADGIADVLERQLAAASDWREGEALPRAALLCHDAMGMAGPARAILESASRSGHPVLFTGHVPAGSPGDAMVRSARAAWIRLPTHPTLGENLAIAAESGASTLVGHSCEPDVLAGLARHLPALRTGVATGDRIEV